MWIYFDLLLIFITYCTTTQKSMYIKMRVENYRKKNSNFHNMNFLTHEFLGSQEKKKEYEFQICFCCHLRLSTHLCIHFIVGNTSHFKVVGLHFFNTFYDAQLLKVFLIRPGKQQQQQWSSGFGRQFFVYNLVYFGDKIHVNPILVA